MSALDYAQSLIEFDSVSSQSNVDVTNYVEDLLKRLEFDVERIEYDDARGVRKACVLGKKGSGTGGMAYFGHTDVVPADDWKFDEHGPFTPTVKGERLYGRGSCDMKGSVACALAAAGQFDAAQLTRPLYLTCTADEEVGYVGALHVAERSELFREMVAGGSRGIIGEPTLLEVVHAHKGTYGIRAVSKGRAAHSSTGEGLNANLAMIPYLAEMKAIHDEAETDPQWQDDRFHPPTLTWNIGINDYTRAVNITAPQSVCNVYFRPMPGMDVQPLLERSRRKAQECGLTFEIVIRGEPLFVEPDSPFVKECLEIAERVQPKTVAYSTDGAALGALEHLLVIGPGDIRQAHTHDEWISLKQLEWGTALDARMIERWCTD